MARRPHPTEIRDAEIIRNAVRFDITLFLGVGRFANATAPNLETAHDEARRLSAENPGSRKPLIYAVDASGRAAPITSNIQPKKEYVA